MTFDEEWVKRVVLSVAVGQGEPPPEYLLVQAARYLGVAPWDLLGAQIAAQKVQEAGGEGIDFLSLALACKTADARIEAHQMMKRGSVEVHTAITREFSRPEPPPPAPVAVPRRSSDAAPPVGLPVQPYCRNANKAV